jgi:hypothetical protein
LNPAVLLQVELHDLLAGLGDVVAFVAGLGDDIVVFVGGFAD